MILKDEKNKIKKFIERPKTEDTKSDYIWVNGSFYIFEPEIFKYIPKNKRADFGADIFPKLLATNKSIYGFPTIGYFVDIGNLEKLEFARKTFKND